MNIKKATFLYGFLLLNSIHWGGVVLTALLGNIIGIVVEFDQLPWIRLVILIIEIIVFFRLLDKKSNNFEIKAKSLLKLMTVSIALFISAQFDYYYEYSPSFCGNALIDGSLDDLLDNRSRNLNYVHIIETTLLSLGISICILKHIKKGTIH